MWQGTPLADQHQRRPEKWMGHLLRALENVALRGAQRFRTPTASPQLLVETLHHHLGHLVVDSPERVQDRSRSSIEQRSWKSDRFVAGDDCGAARFARTQCHQRTIK